MISRRNIFKTLLGISTGLLFAKSVEGKPVEVKPKTVTYIFSNTVFLWNTELTPLSVRNTDRVTEVILGNYTKTSLTVSVYLDNVRKFTAYLEKSGGQLVYTLGSPMSGVWSTKITTPGWVGTADEHVCVNFTGEYDRTIS